MGSSIEAVAETKFTNSTVSFEGPGAGIRLQGPNIWDASMSLLNSSVSFDHGDDAIMKSTTRAYGGLDVVVRKNSLLTFHECTSLARAVHGKDFSGNVTADISSQVLCNHGNPSEIFL